MIFKYFLAVWFTMAVWIQTIMFKSYLKRNYYQNDYVHRSMVVTTRDMFFRGPTNNIMDFTYSGFILGQDTSKRVLLESLPEDKKGPSKSDTISVWYHESSEHVFKKYKENSFSNNYSMTKSRIFWNIVYIVTLAGLFLTVKSIVKHHKRKKE